MMIEMKKNKFYLILLMTFFGMAGSVLIGFIFYNKSIFIPYTVTFQFVMIGLYGALFFSFLEYESLKAHILVMVTILIFQLVVFTGKQISMAYLIRDVIYLGGLFLSVKLYHHFLKSNPRVKYYLRSLALVLFYGVINVLAICIIYIINSKQGFPPLHYLYVMAGYGILIGLGIGLGLDFYFQIEKPIKKLLNINPDAV
jgi:hypothetical protein